MILLWDSIFRRESYVKRYRTMVKFYLATPRRERSAINLSISFRGKQFRRTTKESTLVRFWSQERQKVRVCRENCMANRTNEVLLQWHNAATKALLQFKRAAQIPSAWELFAAVDEEFYGSTGFYPIAAELSEKEEVCSFTDYFERYIARYEEVRSVITIKHYRTTLNKLRAYEHDARCRLSFPDVNIDFYNRFQAWIYGQGYSDNYFGSLIKVIKQVYREARDVDRLHDLNGTAHKGFVTVAKESDPIFLTLDELLGLHRLKITRSLVAEEWPELRDERAIDRRLKTCELVKNRFLIGAFSGLRVSDFSRLGMRNIVDDRIVLRTRKTDTPVVIPLHPVIREILESGFELSKTISDQKMNRYIKSVAKMAGIDQKVAIRECRAGTVREICVEKYKLVSTHTARRSFATNLQKVKDVPLAAISRALGHSKVTTTMRYLRLGAEENAALLAASRFFAEPSEGE